MDVLEEAELKDSLSKQGYCYLTNLPDNFDFAAQMRTFGPLLKQYAGEIVRDISVDPSIPDDVVTPYNRSELTPHTEWYEFSAVPPRYVALLGKQAAAGEGGETTLADGYEMLAEFSHPRRSELFSATPTWTSQGLAREGVAHESRHPVLSKVDDHLIVRFSTRELHSSDDLVLEYIKLGVDFFRRKHIAIKIDRHALLLWDNWRMLHSRRAFSDSGRHLQRILIGSRSSSSVSADGLAI
jgi:alpha-ketoglutarate-dependent taurine dioxygenase